jgi:NAD(P)-dependent dehydrogenase (short-subunit alcohol dehydrogenase family)
MGQDHEYTLITGSSSGIGEALARRLAREGKLILHGRNTERLRAIRSGLPNSDSHLIWRQDLEHTVEAGESLTALLSDSGALVVTFVHCAGECRILPLADSDAVAVARLFRVNVMSATTITRTLLKKHVNRGALRSIVFTSCIASRFGARGFSVYAATKGALDALSRSLAVELAPEVRVNSILPGRIRTRGSQSLSESEAASKLTEGYLLGAGRAEDVAAMAQYLISDQARWITGQQFVVDGGKTAH